MQPFNAIVKDGRLTLDEPSDLPDGQVVVLLPLEELMALAEADGGGVVEIVTPHPRRRVAKSKHVDAAALLEELRAL